MTMCAKYETAKMTSMNVVPFPLPLKTKEYFKLFSLIESVPSFKLKHNHDV